jgi:hypothetical protein
MVITLLARLLAAHRPGDNGGAGKHGGGLDYAI